MSRLKALLAGLPPLIIPATSPQAVDFPKFRQLPREIRNKIWFIAAHQQPRKINLVDAEFLPSWDANVKGQIRQPAMMSVCHESREEGMRYYELVEERPTQAEFFTEVPERRGHRSDFIRSGRSPHDRDRLAARGIIRISATTLPPVHPRSHYLKRRPCKIWVNFAVDEFFHTKTRRFNDRPAAECYNFTPEVLARSQTLVIPDGEMDYRTLCIFSTLCSTGTILRIQLLDVRLSCLHERRLVVGGGFFDDLYKRAQKIMSMNRVQRSQVKYNIPPDRIIIEYESIRNFAYDDESNYEDLVPSGLTQIPAKRISYEK